MKKNYFKYYDEINGSVEEITIHYHPQKNNVSCEIVLFIDEEKTTDKDLKNFFKWVLSYCEGIIEGSHDKHNIFMYEEGEDYSLSCNINDVEIKWFGTTEENDCYKLILKYKPTIIDMSDDKIC